MIELIDKPDGVTGTFCYSLDGESYHGRYATAGAAAAEAEQAIDDEFEDGEQRSYWIGECCHPLDMLGSSAALWRGESIFEDVDLNCGEECAAEDWCMDITKDDKAELGRLVFDFIRSRASVMYYGVRNTTERFYIAGTDALCLEIQQHVRAGLESYLAARRVA